MIGVIPAAGAGTRLLPFTRSSPKELAYYGPKPVIEWVLGSLKKAGVNRSLLVVGSKKGAMMDYVGDGSLFGVRVSYIQQEVQKGLGHAILCAKPEIDDLKEDNFVVFLGDSVIIPERNVSQLIEKHNEKKPICSILLIPVDDPESYGAALLDGDRIIDIFEKPKTQEEKEKYKINGKWYVVAGVYTFSKRIFEYISTTMPGRNNEIQITDAIREAIKSGETVLAHVMADNDKRIDIGSWDYLQDLKDYWSSVTDEELKKIIAERKRLMESLKPK